MSHDFEPGRNRKCSHSVIEVTAEIINDLYKEFSGQVTAANAPDRVRVRWLQPMHQIVENMPLLQVCWIQLVVRGPGVTFGQSFNEMPIE